ncbi:tetraacyldisaccharide 4'-kinase [Candidatus Schneideria nysicola]|uniref:tetraacyldisaccharide 4'-kinase n=1 Tax=Candidatus Schneideria nysicola TaxID=1081631 RepID=UPI001CAA43AC|nr:tetraacyldisaccharide 4'-kinase [Candidatus Schneideria nysicola]UAJ65341.1 tetraacyldisaccharide 4'-kinase [Candidatus Schneideria nysicola]
MINNIWYHNAFLLRLICMPFLIPFSLLYGLITTLIRLSYRIGLFQIKRFPLAIIVIGNLTIGGTGKTPLVIWLVEKLKRRGWRVGVVSRGYGSCSVTYPLLVNSTTMSNQCGDEPLLIWQRTGVSVAVAPRRIDAVEFLIKNNDLDVIVSDDGLQHYALARDIEWVVIDGIRRFGNGWWIPAGPMRERQYRLNSVQEIIVNGGKIRDARETPMKIQPDLIVNLLSNESISLSELKNKKIVAIAGIGYPRRFFCTLKEYGILPIKEVNFSDHQHYQEKDLINLIPTHSHFILLMTEKDAVKCRTFARKNWWYLRVNAILPSSKENLLLLPIEKVINHYLKKD